MERNFNLLTVDEARSILRVGRNVMYDLIKHNGVPHIKVGKQIRIPEDELIAWMKQQIKQPSLAF
ncbi:helix-turn-helix domain-containing protein [Brevibacillus borstelensis]|uniref:helix-turn-helix domain-containing protein n=1 Tax=Brevibacillus borstelensis TaxID=45462 RepID=UPI0014902C61|nr:helix-turn-helix domain-containing protein [Brevibacillus borstelensis]MCM3592678.1 helix-turn-helix domain-containing protein [Brevibacillus borstelensis]NOU53810.1 helix-turn-helix domain-containing protein [Brevibacillus borstelensis]